MAVRFDANTDEFVRTTDILDFRNPYTVSGWFRLTSDLVANSTFVVIKNAANWWDIVRVNSSRVLEIHVDFTSGAFGSTLAVGTWYFIAMVRLGGADIRAFLGTETTPCSQDLTNTLSTAGRTAADRFALGERDGSVDRFDGRAYALKAWSVALTLEELQREQYMIRPSRTANLYGAWPVFPGSGERTRDYSGFGRNWTEGGTLTDEDPAAISWGAEAELVLAAGAAAPGPNLRPMAWNYGTPLEE